MASKILPVSNGESHGAPIPPELAEAIGKITHDLKTKTSKDFRLKYGAGATDKDFLEMNDDDPVLLLLLNDEEARRRRNAGIQGIPPSAEALFATIVGERLNGGDTLSGSSGALFRFSSITDIDQTLGRLCTTFRGITGEFQHPQTPVPLIRTAIIFGRTPQGRPVDNLDSRFI
eukprot:tig00000444_g810.t1